ncbi:MAG: isochorismatase family cysteine hydrolase [Cellulosilyticum sp.]|nr:isochorismatase family cysteine hydrolase [Cellulosilyticum sp.]
MSKVLVVVDMQNDFITGSLGTKEAVAIVDDVVAKIEKYKAAGWKVIYTRDTHHEDYLHTSEGEKLPVEHCIKGTFGWQLADPIAKTVVSSAQLYDKGTFGSVELGEKMKELAEEDKALEVELIGLCTDICVISNALLIKAYAPEVAITVDATCCAGVTPESHKNALEAMKMCQITVQE